MIGIADEKEIMRRTNLMIKFVDDYYRVELTKTEFMIKLGKFVNEYMYVDIRTRRYSD